jgi:hypothetical protein
MGKFPHIPTNFSSITPRTNTAKEIIHKVPEM